MPPSKLASFATSLFFIWGIIFGLIAFGEYVAASSSSSLGVGTSSAVNMSILMWIGGCVFFGGASLICRIPNGNAAAMPSTPEARPVMDDEPRRGDKSSAKPRQTRSYKGCRYAIHGDDLVVAAIDGQPMTWRHEASFMAWVDRHPETHSAEA